MRRLLGVLTLVPLLLLSTVALAHDPAWTVADDFDGGGYSGSTGSHPWAGSWTEVGENNGAAKGSVTVTSSGCGGSCLSIAPLVGLTDLGAYRKVDLSEAYEAELRYELDFPGGILVSGKAEVAASFDGANWTTLKSHSPGDEGSYVVGLPVGGVVKVRLLATGLAVATSMTWDEVHIDVYVPETTTTSTTTAPSTTTTTKPKPVTTTAVPTTTTTPRTTTTIAPAPTTSTSPTTSTTSTTRPARDADSSTTTTAPATTTTSEAPTSSTTSTPTTTTTTTVATAVEIPSPPPPDQPSPPTGPPSKTFGVVVGVEPGLAVAPALDLTAQRGFVVDYLLSAEEVGLDLLANVAVGLVLAWLSTKGLERGRRLSPFDSGDDA